MSKFENIMSPSRCEVPLTAGLLLAPYFFKRKLDALRGNTSYSSLGSIMYPMQGEYGTGRGGYPWDWNPQTGALDGDDGRPAVGDEFFSVETCLAGTGGEAYTGGRGYQNGSLGQGGNALVLEDDTNIGAGGGGGLFGGGSSWITAGAGGGSSAVIIDTPLADDPNIFDKENAPAITVKATADNIGGLLYVK